MGWFGSDEPVKKAPSIFDMNLTDQEREMIALGKIKPDVASLTAYRRMTQAPDFNATRFEDSNMTVAGPLPKAQPRMVAPQHTQQGSGLGSTEKLLQAAEQMQRRNKAINEKGVMQGLLFGQ